jgi:uncharacterized protein YyaL (SSP411 family)
MADTQQPVKLANRVAGSKSPFVRAKARDAVAWQLLDNAAVEVARRSNKLIFLHIGYKACHCECRASAGPVDVDGNRHGDAN